jgi:hypothetical protein
MPCTEKRARLLLARGRARVHRLVPMVIRLTRQIASCDLQSLRLKLDPGSKTTVQSYQDGQSVVVQGISHKHCRVIQRADGYGYFFNRANNAKREQARPQARNAARSALYLPGMNAEVSRAN